MRHGGRLRPDPRCRAKNGTLPRRGKNCNNRGPRPGSAPRPQWPRRMNALYFGDNLEILRNHIADGAVDLVYLDPPFNSKRDYNLLFRSPKGQKSEAQITAFEDSWHWGEQAEREFDELLHQPNTDVAQMMKALRAFLGENDMMAYLAMMANRLLELHRVLKSTGSLYLHCDPTASHYLKVVMDGVFGSNSYQSEIVWRRTGSHNKATRWAPIHDTIFFYTKSDSFTWNNPRRPYMLGHVRDHFTDDGSGGYKTAYYGNVLTGSGKRSGESGQPWQGIDPSLKDRHWAIPSKIWDDLGVDPSGLSQHAKLDLLLEIGAVKMLPGAAWPMYERSITPKDGPAASDIWAFQPYTEGTVFGTVDGIDADVSWLKPQDEERLGYPTQKPLALLERIILASSNEGDVVLDPFCGCGTAVHAAEKLKRQWIGIDITHLAISLIEKRLQDAFGDSCKFKVEGTPKDLASAGNLAERDKYQFQWWAVSLVNAQPHQGKKKGADGGIDGVKYFYDVRDNEARSIIVSVKGGALKADDVRALNHVREREKADIGVLISLNEPTKGMKADAATAGFFEADSGKKYPRIQLLTIEGLLSGTQRVEHPDHVKNVTFKKAKTEKRSPKANKTLFEND
jgi:DNA modification methylase